YVDDVRRLQRDRLVLDASPDHEAVTGRHLKNLVATPDLEPSKNHIDDLLMWVTVRSTYPAFFHVVFGQKKLFVVCPDKPYQAKLRRAPFGFRVGHHYHIIVYVINSAHYSSPHLDKLAAISARDAHTMATNCFAASVISRGRPASRA